MNELVFLLYLLTGIVSGLSAGFFGIGGGIINVPALMGIFYLYGSEGEPVKSSIATSLFIITFTSLSATFTHFRKNKTLKWRVVLILGAGAVTGAVIGARLSLMAPSTVLRRILGVFEFGVAYYFWKERKPKSGFRPISYYLALAGGLTAGFIAGLLGVGGGIFFVPFLTLMTSERHENIVGYSSAMITFASISGSSQFLIEGIREGVSYINFVAGLCVMLTSMISARWGVNVLYSVRADTARKLYSVFLLCVGLRLIL